MEMEKEMMNQFQLILEKLDDNANQIKENRQSILMLQISVENKISKKIETLFDGYKLTHEKQWELENRVEKLEELVRQLQQTIA